MSGPRLKEERSNYAKMKTLRVMSPREFEGGDELLECLQFSRYCILEHSARDMKSFAPMIVTNNVQACYMFPGVNVHAGLYSCLKTPYCRVLFRKCRSMEQEGSGLIDLSKDAL